MAVDVKTSITIDRSRQTVANFAGDPANAPKWYLNIETAEWLGEPVVELGAKIKFAANFLGREMVYTYEIKGFVPGELLVMATSEGPFPMETSYRWGDAPTGGTLMSLRNRGNPSGFSALMAPLMAMAMRRANNKDLSRLKLILEMAPRND